MNVLLLCSFALGVLGDARGEVSVRVETVAEEVEFGEGFPLTVTLAWPGAGPDPVWSERDLAPLTVRLLESLRSRNQGRIEEVRRYRAHAFQLGEIVLPGTERKLRIVSSLPLESPGPVEWPDPLTISPTSRSWYWIAGAVLFAMAGILAISRIRKTRRSQTQREEMASVSERNGAPRDARDRLERWQKRSPQTPEERRQCHLDVASALREALGEWFLWPVANRTSEELAHALQTADTSKSSVAESFREMTFRCDRVKFARHSPEPAETEGLIAAASQFVREREAS